TAVKTSTCWNGRDREMAGLIARSPYRTNVQGPAPSQHANRDEDTEGREDEDCRGGDRRVEIAALELPVDDERQGLGPALDVAGEHDRRPELTQRSRPAHDEPRRESGSGKGHGDRGENLAFGRAVDSRGVLQI